MALEEPSGAAAVVQSLAHRRRRGQRIFSLRVQLGAAEHAAADVAPAAAMAEIQGDFRRERHEVALDGRAFRHRAVRRRDVEGVAAARDRDFSAEAEGDLAGPKRVDVRAAGEADASRRQIGVSTPSPSATVGSFLCRANSPRTSSAKRPIGSFGCAETGVAIARQRRKQDAARRMGLKSKSP